MNFITREEVGDGRCVAPVTLPSFVHSATYPFLVFSSRGSFVTGTNPRRPRDDSISLAKYDEPRTRRNLSGLNVFTKANEAVDTGVDVVETSPGRFVVGVEGRWFRILEREGMVIVSKFRCDMIQVPSGRSEHWLLIKIILMKKIERKTGARSFNPTDLFVRRHIDSKDPSCATRFKFNNCYSQCYATSLYSI